MGVKGLAKLLADEAPDSLREVELKSLHGRKIAIDASMAIYQFLIAVRSGGGPNQQAAMLTNAEGETTSHIQGMFNRTIRFLTEGIRPVYVFDGMPPTIKSHELVKRKEKRDKAQAAMKTATESANIAEQDKQSKRLVRAGQQENHDCQVLLRLMGVPVVLAPCEAEAQAAALAKHGHVYAAASEDMDTVAFQAPIVIRKMTFANAAKSVVQTVDYAKALAGLELTHEQFIDLCILLGCDYCDTIRGVGPKTALKLLREHGAIEHILTKLDRQKFVVPDSWVPNEKKKAAVAAAVGEDHGNDSAHEGEEADLYPRSNSIEPEQDDDDDEVLLPAYVQARKLFHEHEVLPDQDVRLKWEPCQPEALLKFLVDDMGFNVDRVKSSIEKLQAAFAASKKPQLRMDAFFKPDPSKVSDAASKKTAAKRKAEKENSKKNKTGGAAAAKKGRR